MTCYYCNDPLTKPYAKYGERFFCGMCSSQIEHQKMVTTGKYTLYLEKIDELYRLGNEVGTLAFKIVSHFEYWKRFHTTYIKLVRFWFLDDIGYLWVGGTNMAKLPCEVEVSWYQRKVLGCMYDINQPIKRDYQPGDDVIFQIEGSKKKIPGVVYRYSDKLRMYAIQPPSGRAFLAPEIYLTRIHTEKPTHYADAEVLIDETVAWRGYTNKHPATALHEAAKYDVRLRGLAQRYTRVRLGMRYEWDGHIVVVHRLSVPKDFSTKFSEVDASATVIHTDKSR